MDKYLFTVTGRADGSSKFGANNKWAFFPSFAAAWRINQEKFMKNIDWISNLKIRGSWGVTGNQNIPAYSSPEKMNTYTYPIGGVTSVGIGAGNMPNPDLKWETTAITDIGIDLGVFNNRINFTADYYYKKTTDLLWNISVPLTTGFGTVLKNIGSLQNKGLELSLSADVLTGPFKWNTMLNWSTNKNKVLEIPGYIPTQQGTISGHLKVNGSWLEPGLAKSVLEKTVRSLATRIRISSLVGPTISLIRILIYLFISMVPSVMTFIMYYVPKQISSVHGVISGQK